MLRRVASFLNPALNASISALDGDVGCVVGHGHSSAVLGKSEVATTRRDFDNSPTIGLSPFPGSYAAVIVSVTSPTDKVLRTRDTKFDPGLSYANVGAETRHVMVCGNAVTSLPAWS